VSFITPSGRPPLEAHLAPAYQGAVPDLATDVEVSIVMPCLNEAEALAECISEALAALAALDMTGEVVIVDNGSSDGSPHIALAAGARVIHEPNRGYGNACRRGLTEATGRFVVMGDADGSYDFTSLPHFIRPLQNGADMVMGNRLNARMEAGAMPWLHRRIGNPVLTATMNLLFGSAIGDAHCGLRSITKQSFSRLALTSPGMEFASEFLIEAVDHGLVIDQVPIVYRRRFGGEPKLRTFRDGLRHLRLMAARSRRRDGIGFSTSTSKGWRAALATGAEARSRLGATEDGA
jgi:glycosyltransferase involved in cell wall biosynthesis